MSRLHRKRNGFSTTRLIIVIIFFAVLFVFRYFSGLVKMYRNAVHFPSNVQQTINFHGVGGVIVINMLSRRDRLSNVGTQMEKLGSPVWLHVPAVKPTLTDTESWVVPGRLWKQDINYSIGVFGCLLSHVKAVSLASSLQLQSVLIFEDDFNIEQTDHLLTSLQAAFTYFSTSNVLWDMLMLSGNHQKPPVPVGRGLALAVDSLTTHAYVLHQRAYNVVLGHALEYRKEIDLFYRDFLQARGLTFVLVPGQVSQYPSYSNILHRFANYSTVVA